VVSINRHEYVLGLSKGLLRLHGIKLKMLKLFSTVSAWASLVFSASGFIV
jgi:hypothetical protein